MLIIIIFGCYTVGALSKDDLQTENEKFVQELAAMQGASTEKPISSVELHAKLDKARQQVEALQQELDALYLRTFGGVKLSAEDAPMEGPAASFEGV
jgi:hypothetical protein